MKVRRMSMIVSMLLTLITAPAAQEKNGPTEGRKILLQAVEAAGGFDTIAGVTTFQVKTRSKLFQEQTVIELTVTETAQLPDKTKQIMTLPGGERVQILNGPQSWKALNGTVEDLTQAEQREMKRGLFRETINVFRRSKDENLSVELLDKETLGGKTNYILEIRDPGGDFFRLFIDSETFLVSKKTYQGAPEVGLARLEEVYTDYSDVDGIKVPFHIEVRANGKKFIESDALEVLFNIELEEDFFFRE